MGVICWSLDANVSRETFFVQGKKKRIRARLGRGFSTRMIRGLRSARRAVVERLRPAIDPEIAHRNRKASGSLRLHSLVPESCYRSADNRLAGRCIRRSAMVFPKAIAPTAACI